MASPDPYTRLVNTSKLVLPLVGLMILSTLFLFSGRIDPDAAIPYANIDVESAARDQRLTGARYATVGSDGAAIELRARLARPDANDASMITASEIDGVVELKDGGIVNLTSGGARVDVTRRIARLTENVLVKMSTGYQIATSALEVRMDRAEIVSDSAVSVEAPFGTIDAGGMILRQTGGPDGPYRLIFNNKVRLIHVPK